VQTRNASSKDTADVESLTAGIAERLIQIPGIVAVALGGSRARDRHDARSDVDLGLYYDPSSPPELRALRQLAGELDDRGIGAEVTDFGEWGTWVNGGAWLEIDGVSVDWLYRDLGRVARVVDDCVAGRATSDYYLGHPHGFHSHIYLGEVHHAQPLADPRGALQGLKSRVAAYPPRLRDALVQRFLFDAAFMLEVAKKPARRGDVFQVAGCLFRTAAALVQVLYAANERYFLNEKGALHEIATFPRQPEGFGARVAIILAAPGDAPHALVKSCERMEALVSETRTLCEVPQA
jgi:predicted nucleotidyltransferase